MTRAGSAAEAFSVTAERYAESVAPALRPAAAEVVRRAALRPGDRVLDVGTGTGTAAGLASGEGREVIGLDAAAGMLEIARRVFPDLTFVEADFAAIPFDDASFDVVLGVHSVMFASDPVAVMAEVRRVTRPGGRLSVSAPGPRELTPNAVFEPIYRRFGLDVPATGPTQDSLASWARDGGWTEVATDADPGYHLRLDGERGLRSWLATGPRGATVGEWDRSKTDALVAELMAAVERDEVDGAVLLPFGALYLTARRD
ncbi:MAG: methyltransferase domain-containing protein [Chloroflexota bacterium]|nr:methyltransferase domain-containing protein [Chloroflexota bacterium]